MSHFIFLFFLILSVHLFGQQIETYNWPTDPGEAFLSDKYKVTLEHNGNVVQSQVIMSHSKDNEIPDFARQFRGGRTFNWTMFSCDFQAPVTITVEKLFGVGSADVEIFPSPYNITGTLSEENKKVTFTLESQKYVSVNFTSTDNKHTSDGVVKHMLMIFAEPLQTGVPSKTGAGVHVYSENSTIPELTAATTIFFPQGYHDLRAQFGGTKVGNMAEVIGSGKQIYLEGGAYVHGRIYNPNASNVKIFGRGVFTGRDFKWARRLEFNGGTLGVDSYHQQEAHIGFSGTNNTIEGIIVCDGAGHGVNMGNGSATYRHVKFWAWHPNNDGFRPWGANNKVENCFIRACDDALYNKGLTVTNTIFWQGFNGAIVCLGWDGKYHTENTILTDNFILYPEWRNIGNNNGIVMSQIDYDMKGTNVIIRNLHVDGNIPALVNLHTNSGKEDANDYNLPADFTGLTGFVKGVSLNNVTVTGKQLRFQGTGFTQSETPLKSLIRGAKLTNGDTYYIEDVFFTNVFINGVCIDESNKDQFFTIDNKTTKNIKFFGCRPTHVSGDMGMDHASGVYLYPNPSNGVVFIKHILENSTIEVFNIQGMRVHKTKGTSFDASDLPLGIYVVRVNDKRVFKFFKSL